VARLSDEDREWLALTYENVVADNRAKTMAWELAEAAWGERPGLAFVDLVASRAYLRAVIMRSTVTEIGSMGLHELAAIWARGCIGAAEYRLKRQARGGAPVDKAR
jgi:hypothetical protein